MIREIKQMVKDTSVYDYIKEQRQKKNLKVWERESSNRKGPLPHILKQHTLKDYAYKYECSTLVETGTFEGDMVKACLNSFESIFSIELEPFFFRRAVKKFSRFPKVKIIHGDSGEKLAEILRGISSRCVFWLDGHYSAGGTAKGTLDTPIAKEIESVFSHHVKDHVILIDDARCFDGTNDYPKLDLFIRELHTQRADIKIEVYNDVIRITPDKVIIK